MENHERMERELLEQCGQVATLVECFAWLQKISRLKDPHLKTDGRLWSMWIEPRFLKDARDAIERQDSVKVNSAFNGEFATNNKRDIKSVNTRV
ncbi:hypothetical protein ALC53_06665 [Atta colombica]|uniref:Uncharacterized protein n=1 Tax=Atta colombica TaxID=520822 RepID=A0A195BEF5_9HYME|nr:hypothetical protein ALC53_06665 [Atta colombica]